MRKLRQLVPSTSMRAIASRLYASDARRGERYSAAELDTIRALPGGEDFFAVLNVRSPVDGSPQGESEGAHETNSTEQSASLNSTCKSAEIRQLSRLPCPLTPAPTRLGEDADSAGEDADNAESYPELSPEGYRTIP